jgi:hypothetical protein
MGLMKVVTSWNRNARARNGYLQTEQSLIVQCSQERIISVDDCIFLLAGENNELSHLSYSDQIYDQFW